MKKRLRSLFLLIFSFLGMAQEGKFDFNYIESEIYKDAKAVDEITAMHATEDHITTIRVVDKHILWDVFDPNMNKQHQELIKSTKNEYYLGFVGIHEGVRLFTVEIERNTSKRTFFCYMFDLTTKTFKKEAFLTSDYDKNQKRADKYETGRNIKFAVSPNKQFVVFTADDYGYDRNSHKVYVYDTKNFNVLYTSSFKDQEEKFHRYEQLKINDKATVYKLGRTFFKGKSDLKKQKVNYEYVLHTIKSDAVTQTKIPIEGMPVRSLQVYENENEVVLLGFLWRHHKKDIQAIYKVGIDKNGMKIITRKKTDIPEEIYFDLFRKGLAKRKLNSKKPLEDFEVADFITDASGNSYLVAHRVSFESSSSGMPGFTTGVATGVTFPSSIGYDNFEDSKEFENIVVFKFNDVGDILWGRGINKVKQSVKHKAFLKNEQFHIVINADCNMVRKKDGRVKIKSSIINKQCLLDFVFDDKGEIAYNSFVYRQTEGRYYNVHEGFYANGYFVIPRFAMLNKSFIKFY